jgi:tRNA(fMet)-specific endonuclease VapC
MSFLIDTDTCSAYLKGNPVVFNRFLQYTGRLHVSVVTMGELDDWALRAHASPKRLLSIDGLLKEAAVLNVDLAIACKYGESRPTSATSASRHRNWTCSSARPL